MSYTYDYNMGYADEMLLMNFVIFILLLVVFGSIYTLIVQWKIFEKANKPGWAAIVPFYNVYTFYDITWGNGWMMFSNLLIFIPIIGFIAVSVISIITLIKLAKAFGQDGGFACGLIFLPIIFMSILAFSKKYQYIGVPDKNSNQFNSNNGNFNNNNINNMQNNMMYQNNVNQMNYQQPNNMNNNMQNNDMNLYTKNVNRFCGNCGNMLPDNLAFCPNCGKKINND